MKFSQLNKNNFIFAIFLLIIFFSSCSDKIEDFDGFLKTETIRLLSNDEAKNWRRIELREDGQIINGNCFDSLLYQYTFDEDVDTLWHLFIQPLSSCSDSDFKSTYPDIWSVDSAFCANNPDLCRNAESFYFVGSWYIEDPFVTNGKVDEVIVKNNIDSIVYKINAISSINLEMTTQREGVTIFEKFIAE